MVKVSNMSTAEENATRKHRIFVGPLEMCYRLACLTISIDILIIFQINVTQMPYGPAD